jgi:hypothetical protein
MAAAGLGDLVANATITIMVLFPIALIWVAFVLYWAIRKYGIEPEKAADEPRRWPRPPQGDTDGGGTRATPRAGRRASSERGRFGRRRARGARSATRL